ncbi:hypothetical protein LIX60_21485 [Streptomyces sp. S07_1.15]|uniref:hypothetical protein n=1 Tax=Streptomyces sp. S07_1.15 TaxID=2873925 RepID=UPI001D13B62B|nr:hypothetical protein [Streptomyces sp. S07_1.15]MCC3653988.1 hypothetical protein [Streptomyces sp. S07_1.15]
MLSAVAELEAVLPGLRRLRPARRRDVDWREVVRELGMDLPSDYKALSEAYPSFSVGDFLLVTAADPGQEAQFAESQLRALDVLEDLAEAGMSNGYVPLSAAGRASALCGVEFGRHFLLAHGGSGPGCLARGGEHQE